MGTPSRRGGRALRAPAIAAALAAAATLAGGVRAAADPAPPAAAAPLTITNLLAPVELSDVRISPAGDRIAYVTTHDKVDELVVMDLKTRKGKVLIRTRKPNPREEKAQLRQHISYVRWKSADRLVATVSVPSNLDLNTPEMIEAPVHLVLDANGNEPSRPINMKNPGKRSARIDLSSIADPLRDDPDHILMTFLVTLDEIEIDKVDIRDGSRVVLERGDPDTVEYGVDRKGNIVTRYVQHMDGSVTVQGRAVGESHWKKIFDISRKTLKAASEWQFLAFGGPDVIYVTAKPLVGTQGDTQEVRTYDLKTGTLGPAVWSHPKYDVDDIVVGEETGELLAGCYWADVYQCDFKDQVLAANLKGLAKFFDNARSLSIVSKSSDDKTWILHVSGSDEPGTYFLYDVAAHHVEPLGEQWTSLIAERLGRMRRFDYQARDKTPLFAYVTEPPGAGKGPLPLIVMPHGGPEARDYLAFDTWVQFLATRGYVVLQPNFRGSSGFGRKFAEAGHGEWGGRMHDDVTDAVRALIATGRVDPSRICIVGASYGGYEALWAAHAEPDLYRCAVSVDGLSDLKTDMAWERHFGADSLVYKYWLKSMGDPQTDVDRLISRSPVTYAKTWTTPLLLIHGDKDDIVDVAQSRILDRALEAEHKPVRYIEIKKMGHGPGTDEETTRVLSEIESFLAEHLRSAQTPAPTTSPPKPAAPAST